VQGHQKIRLSWQEQQQQRQILSENQRDNRQASISKATCSSKAQLPPTFVTNDLRSSIVESLAIFRFVDVVKRVDGTNAAEQLTAAARTIDRMNIIVGTFASKRGAE